MVPGAWDEPFRDASRDSACFDFSFLPCQGTTDADIHNVWGTDGLYRLPFAFDMLFDEVAEQPLSTIASAQSTFEHSEPGSISSQRDISLRPPKPQSFGQDECVSGNDWLSHLEIDSHLFCDFDLDDCTTLFPDSGSFNLDRGSASQSPTSSVQQDSWHKSPSPAVCNEVKVSGDACTVDRVPIQALEAFPCSLCGDVFMSPRQLKYVLEILADAVATLLILSGDMEGLVKGFGAPMSVVVVCVSPHATHSSGTSEKYTDQVGHTCVSSVGKGSLALQILNDIGKPAKGSLDEDLKRQRCGMLFQNSEGAKHIRDRPSQVLQMC